MPYGGISQVQAPDSPQMLRRRRRFRVGLRLTPDLWRIPLLCCVTGLFFLLVTLNIDLLVEQGRVKLPRLLTVGGPDDARTLLSAMLGAASTVLALIFSAALLVLSIAGSQFGPRILHRFVRDGITQTTIGLFMTSFVNILLTLVVLRQEENRMFVPELTTVGCVIMLILSFGLLMVFTNRVALSIQTQNVVSSIVEDLDSCLDELATVACIQADVVNSPALAATADALRERCASDGAPVSAWHTGFVQEVDLKGLIAAADAADAVVQLQFRPGQFVLEDSVLCRVLPTAQARALAGPIRRSITIGPQRTLEQDIEFGIAQLVEIALRALSPAINDTFTGLTCVDWLSDELRIYAGLPRRLGVGIGADSAVRLLWPPVRFERLVKAAYDPIRQAASDNVAINIRLLQRFARLAEHIEEPHRRECLLQQADAVWEAASRQPFVRIDRADIEAAYHTARRALGAE